jgi:hypothetical protein
MVRDSAWNLGLTLHPARDLMMRNATKASVPGVTARFSTRDDPAEALKSRNAAAERLPGRLIAGVARMTGVHEAGGNEIGAKGY